MKNNIIFEPYDECYECYEDDCEYCMNEHNGECIRNCPYKADIDDMKEKDLVN